MKNATIEELTAPNGEVSDTELESEWQSLDWQSIEKQVSRMQTRISKATISNKNYLFLALKQRAHRRHSRSNPNWVIGIYWHKVGENEYVFSTDASVLISPKEMPIRRHIKVRAEANPYPDKEYFQERQKPGRKCKFETKTASTKRSG